MLLTATDGIICPARAAGTGDGAFNVVQIEHAEAIVADAEAVGLPVVLQISGTPPGTTAPSPSSAARHSRPPARHGCPSPSTWTTPSPNPWSARPSNSASPP